MAAESGTTRRRSKPLGARHLATWGPGGWQVTRTGAGEAQDRLMTAAEYVAGLPGRRPEEELRPYLACPSTMAVFELRRDDARQALGVKVIPYRATPTIYAEPLTAGTQRRPFCDAFPVLARKEPLVRYSWDTPLYLQLCAEMGLDPDEGRPRYRAAYAEIAGELERWLGEVFTDGAAMDSPAGEAKMAAFDLLDLIRADPPHDPALLDALRRRWVRVDPGYLPRFGELDELVHSNALVHTTANPDDGAAAARGSEGPGLKGVA